jgi:hypothetical protein
MVIIYIGFHPEPWIFIEEDPMVYLLPQLDSIPPNLNDFQQGNIYSVQWVLP